MTGTVFFLLLFISFLFAGIEAGLLSLNRVRLRHRVNQKDPEAIALQKLLASPERLMTTVLVVTNSCNIGALALGTGVAVGNFGPSGYWIAMLVALPVYLFGLEYLPKSIFRRFPYRAVSFLVGLLQVATKILLPLHLLIEAGIRLLFRNRPSPGLFVAREEVKFLLAEGERVGTLKPMERQMIHAVVDFRNVKAADLMVPMDRVVSIRSDTSVDELIGIARKQDLDRLPILNESGEMVGLANLLEVLLEYRAKTTASHYLRRIVVSRPSEPAFQVIKRLRAARLSLAAVVDESGHPLGILGSEDIVQRLVQSAGTQPVNH